MTPEEILQLVEAAQGDPARLALAGIDLQFPELPDAERAALHTALQAAAIPHWWDEKILAALLDEPLASQAPALAARLRQLRVVEPFPARGPGAANVHEATRLALRARLRAEDAAGFARLSGKAAAYFAGDPASHARIEALFHRFTAEPEAASLACADLFNEWDNGGRFEALLALGVALEELLNAGLSSGLLRGVALDCLACIRYHHQPLERSLGQSREALEEFERLGDEWRIALALERIGNVLRDSGDRPGALEAYQASLTIRKRLAAQKPGNSNAQRNLSVAHHKVGRIQEVEKRLDEALVEYHAGLSISARLAKENPGNTQLQRDLSIQHDKIGDALRQLGKTDEALTEYRASLGIMERLASIDIENIEWQRDLASTHSSIAAVLYGQGDSSAALSGFQRAHQISELLAARDPGNVQWQLDLARSCGNLAFVLLKIPGGDREEAVRLIARGLERMDALAKMHPPTPAEQKQRTKLEDLRRDPPTPEPAQLARKASLWETLRSGLARVWKGRG